MTPDELCAIEAIKALKFHYVRCVDLKLWDELRDVLTDDVRTSFGGASNLLSGRDEVVGWLAESLDSTERLSSHRVTHPEITLLDDHHATGVWALTDHVILLDSDLTLRGSAYYQDEYRKVDGGWRISATGYERVFEEIEPRSSSGVKLTASRWST